MVSEFKFEKEPLGDISYNSWCVNKSEILTNEEWLSVSEMIKPIKMQILYRATQNGFYAQDFHSSCNGFKYIITFIKNNLNYVFDGYASEAWHSFTCLN